MGCKYVLGIWKCDMAHLGFLSSKCTTSVLSFSAFDKKNLSTTQCTMVSLSIHRSIHLDDNLNLTSLFPLIPFLVNGGEAKSPSFGLFSTGTVNVFENSISSMHDI